MVLVKSLSQNRVGKNGEDSIKDDHGLKLWLSVFLFLEKSFNKGRTVADLTFLLSPDSPFFSLSLL